MFRNPADLPPSKTQEERNTIIQLASQHNHDFKHPCRREEKMSYQCLDENNYVRDKCLNYFENYKNCREFWSRVEKDRRLKGLTPILPRPDDRDRVKEEYLRLWGMK